MHQIMDGGHLRGKETSISRERKMELKRKVTTHKYPGNLGSIKSLTLHKNYKPSYQHIFGFQNRNCLSSKARILQKPEKTQNSDKNTKDLTTKQHSTFISLYSWKKDHFCGSSFQSEKHLPKIYRHSSPRSSFSVNNGSFYKLFESQTSPICNFTPLPNCSTRCLSPGLE